MCESPCHPGLLALVPEPAGSAPRQRGRQQLPRLGQERPPPRGAAVPPGGAHGVRAREVGGTGPSADPSPQRQTNTRESRRPLPPASHRAAPGPQPGHRAALAPEWASASPSAKGREGVSGPGPSRGALEAPNTSFPTTSHTICPREAGLEGGQPRLLPAGMPHLRLARSHRFPGRLNPVTRGHTDPSSGKCQEAMLGMFLQAQRSAPGCGCCLSQEAEDGGDLRTEGT